MFLQHAAKMRYVLLAGRLRFPSASDNDRVASEAAFLNQFLLGQPTYSVGADFAPQYGALKLRFRPLWPILGDSATVSPATSSASKGNERRRTKS